MKSKLSVTVSAPTFQEFGAALAPWLRLNQLDGSPVSDEVIWRRQTDRTSWLTEALELNPVVQWVHTDTAGIDRLPIDVLKKRGILLSNARGLHSDAVSEWGLGAVLAAAKRLDETVRNSDSRVWTPAPHGLLLRGRKIVILGTGSIGGALAKVCSALGMDVVGVSRTTTRRETDIYIDRRFAVHDAWLSELGSAAFLAICLPLTTQTRGLVGESVIAALPADAWIVNVGRGDVLDESALLAAVAGGRIGGAILDTVAHEPLHPDDPLWGHANVIINAHTSSFTDVTSRRTHDLFVAEATRFSCGLRPANAVLLERGY